MDKLSRHLNSLDRHIKEIDRIESIGQKLDLIDEKIVEIDHMVLELLKEKHQLEREYQIVADALKYGGPSPNMKKYITESLII